MTYIEATVENAAAFLRAAGYEVVQWRCTGNADGMHRAEETRGSAKTFGLWWIDGRRWVLDGLREPAQCDKGGGWDCEACKK